MRLCMQPTVCLALECPVCERNIDFEQQAEDLACMALFGATRYAVCPGCLQTASLSTREDPDYQRRARVKLFERFGVVIREEPGAASGSDAWPQCAARFVTTAGVPIQRGVYGSPKNPYFNQFRVKGVV